MGLLHAVVPPGELHSAALELAREMASRSRTAFRLSKETVNRLPESPEELANFGLEFFRELLRSDDMREGIAAFLEKRPPDFLRDGAVPGGATRPGGRNSPERA